MEKIIKNTDAYKKQQSCFFCKRFFCAGYHHPHTRIVCSGCLPQWEWLYFLMRNVSATDTCKKFKLHKVYKQRQR